MLATPRGVICGPPPLPGELPERWTLGPVLLLGLAAVGLACVLLGRGQTGWRRGCLGAGWAVVVLSFVSPLCALAVALFSARVAQHMLLALVAAPLLVLGLPGRRWQVPGLVATACFAALFWLWHLPAPYDASLRGDLLYWTSHLSLLAASVLLWRVVLAQGAGLGGYALGALASAQMGLLGAVLVFAPAPLYAAHALSALGFGLTPLQDQQLGGLLMWVPGGAAFLLAATGAALRLAREPLLREGT